jgi:UDP-N-acetylglucosamine 2-epimerase (non-hydrolysing)
MGFAAPLTSRPPTAAGLPLRLLLRAGQVCRIPSVAPSRRAGGVCAANAMKGTCHGRRITDTPTLADIFRWQLVARAAETEKKVVLSGVSLSESPTVLIIFGTRPEAIKMLPVIAALRRRPEIRVVVCSTGQHREMLDQVLAWSEMVPDHDLGVMQHGQSLESLAGRVMLALGPVIEREHPARLLVHGDTTTALAGALCAHYRGVPVGHVEAGLRSGDRRHPWPEEVNRTMIATLADQHFAPTENAARALRSESVPADRIFVTGNTGIDALLETRRQTADGRHSTPLIDRLLERTRGKRLIVLTVHRRENLVHGLETIARAVRTIAARGDVAIACPLHRNPRISDAFGSVLGGLPNVHMLAPLDYPSFVALLAECFLVLTDSGGIQEEAPALGKPVIILRETTERPEGLALGGALLAGTSSARIIAAVSQLLDDPSVHARMSAINMPYGRGAAAEAIAAIVARSLRAPRS